MAGPTLKLSDDGEKVFSLAFGYIQTSACVVKNIGNSLAIACNFSLAFIMSGCNLIMLSVYERG